MECPDCNGLGEGGVDERPCFRCDGAGELCDVCGESPDACICLEEDSEGSEPDD